MTPFLESDIKSEEGLRLTAYPDPLTGGAPWTIGWGCTGAGIAQGVTWTLAQAEAAIQARIAAVVAGLDHMLPWWRQLSDPRQDVLVQMAYQMGVEGLLAFRQMLAAAQAALANDNYVPVAQDMGQSRWARQTTNREQRLARQMLTGVRQAA